jgi:hypothetical protein
LPCSFVAVRKLALYTSTNGEPVNFEKIAEKGKSVFVRYKALPIALLLLRPLFLSNAATVPSSLLRVA